MRSAGTRRREGNKVAMRNDCDMRLVSRRVIMGSPERVITANLREPQSRSMMRR